MKKKSLLMIILAIIFFPLLLVACDDVAVLKSIAVKPNTLPLEVIVGESLDTSNTVVVANYSNDATKEVNAEDLTFSEIDTSTIGYKELTITYGSKSIKVQIKVVNSITDTYNIVGVEKPKFVMDYLDNIKTQDNKELEFVNRADGYFVGDDNEFVFLPIITALDENNEELVLNKYISVSQVFVYENNVYSELTGNNLTNIVNINNENSTFDFTEHAINKTIKISVRPLYLTTEQEKNAEQFTVTFEFKVVDGWNIYDVANLSRFDNNAGTESVWSDYKNLNNIGNEPTNAIILHNDLALTTNDIPAEYKWKSDEVGNTQLVGNLKNDKSIYTRYIPESEKFEFVGNYFTIDASKMPLISFDEDSENESGSDSHTMLFAIGGDNYGSPSGLMGDCVIKNTNFIGNGQRSEDVKYSGSLNLLQTNSKNQIVDNTISRRFFTNFLFIKQDTVNVVDKSKAYDSFSCMIYAHQAANNTIKNSDFKGAGGPLIILTHVRPGQDFPNDKFSNMNIEDSTLEALVTGEEAWFVSHGASELAAQIKAMNRLFTGTSQVFKNNGLVSNVKGFVNKEGKINMVCLIMASDDMANTKPIRGKFEISKNNKVVGSLNVENETLQNWISAIGTATGNPAMGYKLPYFATNDGGFSTLATDGKSFAKWSNGFASLDETDANMFTGDYLSAYLNGGLMGMLCGYFNLD